MANTKAMTQVNTLALFYKTMALDNDKVAYGPKYVFEVIYISIHIYNLNNNINTKIIK